jgi:hypothetical protein
MPDDLGDVGREVRQLRKDVNRLLQALGGGADSSHPGTGTNSVALGFSATAAGGNAVAVGRNASASGSYNLALGGFALASNSFSTAVGAFCEATGQNSAAFGIDATAFGEQSVAVGVNASANALNATSMGRNAFATAVQSSAFGESASAGHSRGTAIGQGAATTAANQVRLGTASDTVSVPGTFSNPSARHLKQNIEPAPELQTIFPALFEWEYIDAPGRRRLGPMADDLVGTDAERFVTFDDEGNPAGIDVLGLLVAQVARLSARVVELENLEG